MHYFQQKQFLRLLAVEKKTERVSGNVIIMTAIFIGFIVLALAIYIQIDYRRHRRPLKEIDPEVHYSHIHHVQVVVLPMAKFRTRSFLDRIFHRIAN